MNESPPKCVVFAGLDGFQVEFNPTLPMKHLYCAAAAIALSLSPISAEETLVSPKPTGPQGVRVLLHINGNPHSIDYPDVYRVLCSEPLKIVFETVDGCVVVHQGTYTVMQQKGTFAEHQARGVRFYDVK